MGSVDARRSAAEDLVARLLDGVPESAEGLAPEAAVEGEDKDEDEAVTGAVERALAGLTTRERLAVALVEFDDLPSRAADDLVGSAHASGWALAAIDKELAWLPWPVNGGEALRRWVEHESTDLVDGDLLQAAEARLARGRRRNRLIGAGCWRPWRPPSVWLRPCRTQALQRTTRRLHQPVRLSRSRVWRLPGSDPGRRSTLVRAEG
jgi:hypothetical protein